MEIPPPPPSHGPFHSPDSGIPYGAPAQPASLFPMELGRGVSVAWSLFRFGWRKFAAISLITAVPIALVTAGVAALSYDDLFAWERASALSGLGQGQSAGQLAASYPWWSLGLSLLASFAVGPIALLGGAALIYAISRVISGAKVGVRASFSAALGNWRQLLLLFIVLVGSGLAISLFTVLAPVISALGPGGLGLSGLPLFFALIVGVAVALGVVFLVIRLSFTLQALMIEDKPARQALQRSWSLTSGSMLRIVAWAIIFSIVVGLLGVLVEIPAAIVAFVVAPPNFSLSALAAGGFVTPAFLLTFTFLTTVFAAFVQPIISIGLTLLYFDIRHRRGEQAPNPGKAQPG